MRIFGQHEENTIRQAQDVASRAETASRIGQALEKRKPQKWLKFVDLNGSRAWVRSDRIESIAESTELQRTSERDFQYLRRKEDRTARRWDDEEY